MCWRTSYRSNGRQLSKGVRTLPWRRLHELAVPPRQSPHLRAHFHGAHLGRSQARGPLREKFAGKQADRRVVGNCRSTGSTKRREQRTAERQDAARTLVATSTRNLRNIARSGSLPPSNQTTRCPGETFAASPPTGQNRGETWRRIQNGMLVRRSCRRRR